MRIIFFCIISKLDIFYTMSAMYGLTIKKFTLRRLLASGPIYKGPLGIFEMEYIEELKNTNHINKDELKDIIYYYYMTEGDYYEEDY